MDFIGYSQYSNEAGIYQIKQISTGKMYIGQTSQSFKRRYWMHQYHLRHNVHDNRYLQAAWNKYGEDDFVFGVIEVCKRDKSFILEREVYYIGLYDTFKSGFNLTSGGEGAPGVIPTPEARRKIGEVNRLNMLGKKHTEETKAKMRASSRHLSPSDSTREAVRQYMMHRVVSDETKDKLRRCNAGSKSSFAVIDEQCAAQIKQRLIAGESASDVASSLGVKYNLVRCIAKNETWTCVEVDGWDEFCSSHPRQFHCRSLDDDTVRQIRADIASGVSCKDCASKYDVELSRIYNIKNRKFYKDVV